MKKPGRPSRPLDSRPGQIIQRAKPASFDAGDLPADRTPDPKNGDPIVNPPTLEGRTFNVR